MKKIYEWLKLTPFYEVILPIIHKKQLHDWLSGGKKPPTPHLIKQRVVKEYALKYSIKTFVETGTYMGSMVNATKFIFDKIFTIELDKSLYIRAKKKFANLEHISVFLGDSAEVLPKVLKKIGEPSISWLDAHYSSGITAKGKVETPIIAEIQSILDHKIKKHIILIDDASLFIGKNNYPTIKALRIILNEKHPNHILKKENDIIQIILNP